MITIVPAAHISKKDAQNVKKKILEIKPDVVAVELCQSRFEALVKEKGFDLKGNVFVLIANVLLYFLQRNLGNKVGVKPGMEMLAAIEAANEIGIKFALIDRDIKITIKRAISKMSLLEKLRALKEMMGAFVLSGKEVQKEMEKAKTENGMARLLGAFEKASPSMYEVLVRERDAYMAKELLKLQEKFGNIVAVVGAGHKKGIEEYLSHPERISRFWTGK